jgi:hypothetical protein
MVVVLASTTRKMIIIVCKEALLLSRTVLLMLDNGWIINVMDTASRHGQTVQNTKVTGEMIKLTGMEN